MTRSTTTVRYQAAWRTSLDEPVVAVESASGTLAAAGSEGTVLLLTPAGDRLVATDLGDPVQCLAVAPDGHRVAAAGCVAREIWTPDGTSVHRAEPGWCTALAWTAAGGELAAAEGRRVVVTDADGGPRFNSEPLGATVAGLVWLRDGRRLAVGAYGSVYVFEPATGRTVHHFDGSSALTGLTAPPKGRWVVGGDHDLTVHGWQLPSGDDVQMRGFPSKISALEFDDSGRWLATPSADDVPVWDFSSPGPAGRPPVSLLGHADPVTALSWRPGSDVELVTGDLAGTVALWRIRGAKRGDAVRPSWTVETGDPVTDLTFVDTQNLVVGHRSGAVTGYRAELP